MQGGIFREHESPHSWGRLCVAKQVTTQGGTSQWVTDQEGWKILGPEALWTACQASAWLPDFILALPLHPSWAIHPARCNATEAGSHDTGPLLDILSLSVAGENGKGGKK